MCVVMRVARVPFEEDFVLAVAIDIADAGIVGAVVVAASVRGGATLGAVERDAKVVGGTLGF